MRSLEASLVRPTGLACETRGLDGCSGMWTKLAPELSSDVCRSATARRQIIEDAADARKPHVLTRVCSSHVYDGRTLYITDGDQAHDESGVLDAKPDRGFRPLVRSAWDTRCLQERWASQSTETSCKQ